MGIHDLIEAHRVTDEEKRLIDSYLELHDKNKKVDMKTVNFSGFHGGTNQIAHEAITETYTKIAAIFDTNGVPTNNKERQEFQTKALEYLLTPVLNKLENSDPRMKVLKERLNALNHETYSNEKGKEKKRLFVINAVQEVLGLDQQAYSLFIQAITSGDKSKLDEQLQQLKPYLSTGLIEGKKSFYEKQIEQDYASQEAINAYIAKKHTDFIRNEFNPRYHITDIEGYQSKDFKTLTTEHYKVKNGKNEINVEEELKKQGYGLMPEQTE